MSERIDALFIPFYTDIDRWHNDTAADYQVPSLARTRATLAALSEDRWMKDEVDIVIDGKLLDFSRFLSWVRNGTTANAGDYDPFNMTLLSGSYYLSFLSRQGYNVRVVNTATRENLPELGRRYNPRFVLLSTTLLFDAVDRELVLLAVSQLRQTWPEAIIVLGGLSLVSYARNLSPLAFRRLLLRYGADAYVVSPRGEIPLLAILSASSLSELAEGNRPCSTYVVYRNEVLGPPTDPDPEVPMDDGYIRWSSLPQRDHLYHTVHTRTARSCAFRCAFCEYPVNQGPLTLTSTDSVAKELAELKALGTVRSLVFTDDTFNVPMRRFKELMRLLARHDFEWYSFFRPQYADAETAALMKAAGCKAVFAGLEAADDRILRNMNKAATVDQYRRGIEQLKRQGINVHANFIVGFPGETEETASKISAFLDDMAIEFCTVCTWAYIPSTPIGTRRQEFGIVGNGLAWQHNTMTSEEAERLARQVISSQKSAVHNAVRGEAWMEFLLYANGFSVGEVQQSIRFFNSCIGQDCSEDELRRSSDFRALQSVLQRHPMPSPRW